MCFFCVSILAYVLIHSYNEEIMVQTIRWAMTENIKNPAQGILIHVDLFIEPFIYLLSLFFFSKVAIDFHKYSVYFFSICLFIYVYSLIYLFIFFEESHSIPPFLNSILLQILTSIICLTDTFIIQSKLEN